MSKVLRASRLPEKIVFAGASLGTIYAVLSGKHRLQYLLKPLVAPALAVIAARDPEAGSSGKALAAGLVAATVGDVCMIDSDQDSNLRAGVRSFAAMHGVYVAILRSQGAVLDRDAASLLAPNWLGAAGVLALKAGRNAPMLATYGALLATTVAHTAGSSAPGRRKLTAGGISFFVSDSLIAVRRYLVRREESKLRLEAVVLATYFLAQWLLVAGMLENSRDQVEEEVVLSAQAINPGI